MVKMSTQHRTKQQLLKKLYPKGYCEIDGCYNSRWKNRFECIVHAGEYDKFMSEYIGEYNEKE